jgi:hypothetical protein
MTTASSAVFCLSQWYASLKSSMMFLLPSGDVELSTTDGEEYAFEVTHVQCTTKKRSSPSEFKITIRRVSIPKIPFWAVVAVLAATAEEVTLETSSPKTLPAGGADTSFSFSLSFSLFFFVFLLVAGVVVGVVPVE